MKLKHLFLAFVAGATSLVSCELLEQFGLNEEDLGLAELTVDLTELTLPKEGNKIHYDYTVEVTNRFKGLDERQRA